MFAKNGFEALGDIALITESDLEDMQVARGHIRRLLYHIVELKQNQDEHNAARRREHRARARTVDVDSAAAAAAAAATLRRPQPQPRKHRGSMTPEPARRVPNVNAVDDRGKGPMSPLAAAGGGVGGGGGGAPGGPVSRQRSHSFKNPNHDLVGVRQCRMYAVDKACRMLALVDAPFCERHACGSAGCMEQKRSKEEYCLHHTRYGPKKKREHRAAHNEARREPSLDELAAARYGEIRRQEVVEHERALAAAAAAGNGGGGGGGDGQAGPAEPPPSDYPKVCSTENVHGHVNGNEHGQHGHSHGEDHRHEQNLAHAALPAPPSPACKSSRKVDRRKAGSRCTL